MYAAAEGRRSGFVDGGGLLLGYSLVAILDQSTLIVTR